MNYIISDIESLEKLTKDKNLRNSIRKIQLNLKITNIESYSKQINKYYFSCGCKQGAISFFVSILIVIFIYFTIDSFIFKKWWYIALYLFLGTLIGKIYGIIFKEVMIKKIIKTLKKELSLLN